MVWVTATGDVAGDVTVIAPTDGAGAPHFTADPERIYDMLLSARTAEVCTLHFKDGRAVHGALIFNPFKGTGRIIDVDMELSIDFEVDDIRDLKLT